jgi:hypothetical protein
VVATASFDEAAAEAEAGTRIAAGRGIGLHVTMAGGANIVVSVSDAACSACDDAATA